MMDFRQQELTNAYNGLKEFGVFLVSYKPPYVYPTGIGDDLLLYIIVPWLSHILSINVKQAANLFFNVSTLIALCLAFIGFALIYKNHLIKLLSALICIVLIKGILIHDYIFDIYRIGVVVTLSIVPIFLYFQTNRQNSTAYKIFLIFCGFIIVFSQYMRSFSSFPILFLILFFILFDKKNFNKKMILISCLGIGMFIPFIVFTQMLHKRNAFLETKDPTFKSSGVSNSHLFWHQIYIGFGTYPNPYGLEYKDSIAVLKAKSIKPDVIYPSAEYEHVLKSVVFDFIYNHFFFVMKITLKKIFSCLTYINPFEWIGILFFFLFRRHQIRNFGIIVSLLISLLPGVVATPSLPDVVVAPAHPYLSTFIALIWVYTIFGYSDFFDWCINKSKFLNKRFGIINHKYE